jgi:hypothetical protein
VISQNGIDTLLLHGTNALSPAEIGLSIKHTLRLKIMFGKSIIKNSNRKTSIRLRKEAESVGYIDQVKGVNGNF